MLYYLLLIIGGVFLFLYGIFILSNALSKIAGNKIKKIIKKATNSNFFAVIIGIILTCVFNSSSAICVILITFLSANLISLKSSMYILMGANIGTTITSFVVSLDITKYYMFFIIFGCIILLSSKLSKYRLFGELLFGLGIFFMGLAFISDNAIYIFAKIPNLFISILDNNIIKNIIISSFFTGVVQSSTASIKITQELFEINFINLAVSACFVLGANIGTTITGFIASIKCGKHAKRLALFNFCFNFFTCVFVIFTFNKFLFFTELLSTYLNLSKTDTITLFHFLFNLTGILIFSALI